MSETDHGRKISPSYSAVVHRNTKLLQSASAIVENLDREKYEPILVGISKEGKWFLYRGSVENIRQDKWLTSVSDTERATAGADPGICLPAIIPPDRGDRRLLVFDSSSGTVTERIYLDAALPVLHGKNGEDGSVQGLLALADIPVAGCGITSSALCMDKNLAHQLAAYLRYTGPTVTDAERAAGRPYRPPHRLRHRNGTPGIRRTRKGRFFPGG